MKDLEINVRVCNKLLNRVMKDDYGYDNCLFRIDPIHYINNRNRGYIPRKFHNSEEILLKCKNKSVKVDLVKMKKELSKTINVILNMIEGSNFRKVLLIYIKVIE